MTWSRTPRSIAFKRELMWWCLVDVMIYGKIMALFRRVLVVHLDWSGWVGVGAVMMAWLGISVWVEQLA
jgi:hypothetical protein